MKALFLMTVAFGLGQCAKADEVVFPFTCNTTAGVPITAKESFTADFGHPTIAGLDWDVTFTSTSAFNLPLELTKENSILTVFPNTSLST